MLVPAELWQMSKQRTDHRPCPTPTGKGDCGAGGDAGRKQPEKARWLRALQHRPFPFPAEVGAVAGRSPRALEEQLGVAGVRSRQKGSARGRNAAAERECSPFS